tara:strand:- start:4315 stop:4572 length:258 start_codon:yes stop_codon:yes gene_type:complete
MKQAITDYFLGVNTSYKMYIHRFWERIGLVAVSGDHGFMDMDPMPLGYSDITDEMMEATHRRFIKNMKRLGVCSENYETIDDTLK